MYMCNKCSAIGAWTALVVGILFLLRDLNVWDFWNIQWWTVLFIVWGGATLCSKSCPDCMALQGRTVTKKK